MTRGIVRHGLTAFAGAVCFLAAMLALPATAATESDSVAARQRAALERLRALRLAQADAERPRSGNANRRLASQTDDEEPADDQDAMDQEEDPTDEDEPLPDDEEVVDEQPPTDDPPTAGGRELTPEQRRQIEELRKLRDTLREQAGDRPEPPTRRQPRAERTPAKPAEPQRPQPQTNAGDTVVVDTPDPTAQTTGDGKNWFQYDDRAWEDVVRDFARRLGKPLMNAEEIMIGGTLTYKSERMFTKQEAIDELNFLLHEKGFHFVEERDRIRVVPIMEMPQFVPTERVFQTVASYRAANLSPMEYAIVFARVEGRDAEQVADLLGINLTDQIFIDPFGDTNQIKLSGVRKDIDRFLTLMERVETEKFDPKTTRFFPIKTNVRTIEQMVRSFFGTGRPQRRYNRQTRKWETTGGGDAIQISADERTNTLIVRALPEDLNEIEDFLQKIDDRPDIGEFKTQVKKIQYASASEVASILNQIFQVEQGDADAQRLRMLQQRRTAAQRRAAARRGRQPNRQNQTRTVSGNVSPQDIIGEGAFERARKTIRIAAIDRTNSIAVYANEEGQQRVDEMLEEIDRPQPTNLRKFELTHVEVGDVTQMIEQLVNELADQLGTSQEPAIVPDPTSNSLYVMADAGLITNVEDIINRLDIEGPARERHVVQLVNVSPSEMIQVIQAAMSDGSGEVRRSSRFRRGRFRRQPMVASSTGDMQLIPLESSQTLVVICTAEEWEEIQGLIEITDAKADLNTPRLKTFTVTEGDAQDIARVLGQFYRRYERPPFPPSQVLVHAEDQTIYVQAVEPALEEIGALIASMDVAGEADDVRILPLQHADASQVANQVQAFIGSNRRRRSPDDPVVQAEPVTNSLIIQAEPNEYQRIEKFVLDIDERVGAQAPEQKFFVLKYAQPREVAQAVQTMFSSGGGSRSRRRGVPVGTRVNAVASGKQVIVDAPQNVMPQVTEFITQLDDPKGGEIVIETITLAGADVVNISNKLTQAFRVKQQNQAIVARFDADPSSETILLTCSRDALDEAKKLIAEYEAAYKGLITQVEFVSLQHAKADQAARWLDQQLTAWMQRQFGRNAARQLKVSHQSDTNRVIINAPQVAVEHGKTLLEQYDQKPDAPGPSPVRTETYKLAGLDVNALARTLDRTYRSRPRRPDRLEASFEAERITETLVVSAPADMFEEIEKLVNTFKEETEDLTPVREFIAIQNAEANYIAGQARGLLTRQIRETRGRNVADRISITPDTRLNRVIVDAPKFVIPMAQELIGKLDEASEFERELIHTIQLENADANAVSQVLNRVLRERMRTKRDLSITVEPMTNSLIVTADQSDWEEIQRWASDLDQKALDRVSEPQVFPIEQANPWEVRNVLRATFQQRRYGRRRDETFSFEVLGGKHIVVQAPTEKMEEITKLITRLDSIGEGESVEYRVYEFPGVGDNIDRFARQVEGAVNTKISRAEGRQAERINVSSVGGTDALIVTALPSQFAQIEAMFKKFEPLWEQQTTQTVFVKLEHVAAGQIVRSVDSMATTMIAREQGRRAARDLDVTADRRTNRLIVTAPETVMDRVKEVIAQLDVPPDQEQGEVRAIPLANANAGNLVRVLRSIFRYVNEQKRDDLSHIPIRIEDDMISNSLLVIASDEDFERVKKKALEIDEQSLVTQAEPQLFKLQHVDPWQLRGAIDAAFRETGRGWGTRRNQQQDVQVTVVGRSLLVQAPQAKMEKVGELIAQLDVPESREGQLRVLELTNADANAVANSLRPLARERNQQNRRNPAYVPIQIVPENVTNALYVIAGDDDFGDIQAEVKRIDDEAATIDNAPVTLTLDNADPNQVAQTISRMFRQGRRSRGGPEVEVTVANNTVVVKAPEKQLEAIRKLVKDIDALETGDDLQVETFSLNTLNAQQVASQVNAYLLSISMNWPRGKARPAAFAEPTTNTLVVMAPQDKLPFVRGLIAKLETMDMPTATLQRYQLENARAEQIQPSVDAMLQAKIRERAGGGRQAQSQVSVVANDRSNELVVFAADEYQALAAELITMLDSGDGQGRIIHIITLEDADASEMADTLNDIVGDGGGGGRSFFRRFSRFRGASMGGGDELDVDIVADVQTNSLLLKGLPQDVAAVESLIEELKGRGAQVPELQIFTLENASPTTVVDMLNSVFVTGRSEGQPVNISVDEFTDQLYVTASQREMRKIESYIEQLDTRPEQSSPFGAGKELRFIDIYRGDAWDVAWEVQGLLPLDGPTLEPDWFGEYIKVVGRPTEIEQIEDLIRQVEKRQRVERTATILNVRNPDRVMPFLQENHPETTFRKAPPTRGESIIIDVWPEDEKPPIKQQKEREQAARGARPMAFDVIALAQLDAVIAQATTAADADAGNSAAANPPAERDTNEPDVATGPNNAGAPSDQGAEEASPERERATVTVLDDGRLLIEGPVNEVENLIESVELIQEDLKLGEVIRVFRFKYGNVNTAAEVIDRMFNDRAARLRNIRQQQQQQREAQQRQQQQQQGDEEGGRGGQQQPPQQRAQPQQAETRVRLATDPSRNYLIVKCDESDLDDIVELLRILDDVPAVDQKVNIFQLENLQADEAADNIKSVLGIESERRSGRSAQARGRRGGQDLVTMLEEEVSISVGAEGVAAQIEAVQIVPNSMTNSLMVAAPRDVMDIIDNVIKQLEDLGGRDVTVIRDYQLANASVADVLPLLREIFDGTSQRQGGERSPANLGPVTVTGDPRSNSIIFVAQAKDIDAVLEQIRLLDIEGDLSGAESYVVVYGDAVGIADTVSQIYATDVAPTGRRGRNNADTPVQSTEVRIVAEPTTNTIVVWAPVDKRAQILERIKEFDQQARRQFREIDLQYADADQLAQTLSQMFGGSSATTLGSESNLPWWQRSRRAQQVNTGGGVVIVADDNTQRLLVQAPDEVFEQIKEMAATLDQPNEQFAFRRFTLQYAKASNVKAMLDQALQEFVRMGWMTDQQADFDQFTAIPDTRTNSLLVAGSPETFELLQSVLAFVDVPTPDDQQTTFRAFTLDLAEATLVAEAINSFSAGVGAATGGGQRGRRGGMFGFGMSGGAETAGEVTVQAMAEPASNSVLVMGSAEDIAIVEERVIQPLERTLDAKFTPEEIAVENASASQVASFIRQLLNTGGDRDSGQGSTAPQIVPNDAANKLIVTGTASQRARIRDLVERFDDPSIVGAQAKIIPLPRSLAAASIAQMVERSVNESERTLAQAQGRDPNLVVIGSEDATNALIITGEPSAFGLAQTIVDGLKEAYGETETVSVVIELDRINAQDAMRVIEDMQQRRGGSRAQPGRGNQRGGRRGSFLWNSPQQPQREAAPQMQRSRRPFIGALLATPLVFFAAADTATANDASEEAKPNATATASDIKVDPAYGRGVGVAQPNAREQAKEDDAVSDAARRLRALRLELAQRRAERQAAAGTVRTVSDESETPAPARRRVAAQPVAQANDARNNTQRRNAPAVPPDAETVRPAEIAGPVEVRGELRGDVDATQIDNDRIYIRGDREDVNFLIELLRSMEASAPESVLEVITLENAKATALVEIVRTAVESLVQARTGGQPGAADRFSITAEARSNSLIIAASEQTMDEIKAIVNQLDKEGERDVRPQVVQIENVRASEIKTQLTPIIQQLMQQREIPQEVQPSIYANDRANNILVIGTPNEIEEITEIVAALDTPLDQEDDTPGQSFGTVSEMLIVNLDNNVPDQVAEVLNEMIEAEQERARTALTGDEAGAPVVRQLQLRTADGEELPPLDLEKPIRLIPVESINALLVYSTPKNNTALTAIIDAFDELPIGQDTDVKAFALEHAAADRVAELIEEVFEESDRTLLRAAERGDSFDDGVMPPVPPGVAAKGLPYRISVSSDPRTNTVFVIGRKDAVILAGGLIQEMDQPSASLALKPRIIELKAIQASQMAETITELLDERQEALGGGDAALRDAAVIQPIERTNSLIIVATDDVFEMIDEIIFQLDSADSYRVIATEFVSLKAADAVKLQTLLQEVFDAKEEAADQVQEDSIDSLTITADPRNNALVLTGTRDFINEAKQMISDMDLSFSPTVQLRVFNDIRLNSARNIATRLEEMVDEAFATGDTSLTGTPIHIDYDPVIDGILVAAAQEDIDMIGSWVEILDQPARFDSMTAIVPLARAEAEEIAETVSEIFAGEDEDGFVVSIRADENSNSVVVKAPPTLLNEIEAFIREIDTLETNSMALVRIFKLNQADAQEAGELLNNILAGEGGAVGGDGDGADRENALRKVMVLYQEETDSRPLRAFRDEIIVTSVIRNNSLVVQAPREAFPLVQSLINAIDVPPDMARVRVFKLRNSDPEEMVETLEAVFEERATGEGDGNRAQLGLTDRLGIGGRQEISFAADLRTDSIIAAGTRGYLDVAEELILELDSEPIEERRTIVYDPLYLPADSIVNSLQELSDSEQELLDELGDSISAQQRLDSRITAVLNEEEDPDGGTQGNKAIISFASRREPEIMNILRELDVPPPQVSIEVLILEVTTSNSLELGVEFAAQDLQYTAAGPTDTTTFDYVFGTDIGAAGSGLGGFSFTITGRDFNFLLRTLQTESDVRVLSRPHIVAMDNKLAEFRNEEEIPFITSQGTTGGGEVVTQIEREGVGIVLSVVPQINPDGFIRLEVEQEISSVTDSNITINGTTQPITFTRETNTTINVKDNETVVLGGLITDRETRTENKIPLIGDIPILGNLFRFNNNDNSRSELLVVMTPRIIYDVEDYRDISVARRDEGYLSPETKANPLMNKLRVPLPGEVETIDEQEELYDVTPQKQPVEPRERPRRPRSKNVYGPLSEIEAVRDAIRPDAGDLDRQPGDSYRIPVGMNEAR